MAVIDNQNLQRMRQFCAAGNLEIAHSKTQGNNAVQAIEDWFDGNRPGLNGQLNAATAPLILSSTVKRKLLAAWLNFKFGAENV